MAFDYFRGEQSEQFTFYRTPKVLYTAPVFRKLSPLSKQLYGILLDRVSLSIRNGWMDEAGRVYVYYTTKQVMEALSCSDKTATKMLDYSGSPEPVNPIFRATCSDWQSRSE